MSIEVRGIVWVGTRTDRYDETVRFFRDGMGLPIDHEQHHFTVFHTPDGGAVEVFGPDDTEHTHFDSGPVAGFLVDDVTEARAKLEQHGADFIGDVHEWEPTGEAWSHFRAPDGNVYELAQQRRAAAARRGSR